MLGRLLGAVERPFVLVAGGAKVDDKLGVLVELGARADSVLVGGKMAEQLRDENPLPYEAELPVDVVGAAAFEPDAESRVAPYHDLPGGPDGARHRARDAGTLRRRPRLGADRLLERTDGRLRVAAPAEGTKAVAEAVAAVEGYTVVGGGDSSARSTTSASPTGSRGSRPAAVHRSSFEGKQLPGVAAIPEENG